MTQAIPKDATTREIRQILFSLEDSETSPYLMSFDGEPYEGLTVRQQRNILFQVEDQDAPCPYTFELAGTESQPVYEARIEMNGRYQFLAGGLDAASARERAERIIVADFIHEIQVKTKDEWAAEVSGDQLRSIINLTAVATAAATEKE